MSSGIIESQSTQNQQGAAQQQGASRSKLVQRLLAASSNLPAFINDLLTTQAVVVAGTEAAAFLIERQGPVSQEAPAGQFTLRTIAHIRPDQSTPEQRAAAIAAFQEIIRPCVVQGKDGAVEIGSPDDLSEPQYCLITLLRNEGQVVAVSAVITRCRDLERARQRLISMQLVAGYFELYSLRRGAEQTRIMAQSHQHVLQLATAVATAEGFESACMNLANELAARTGASRVSIGWKKGRYVRVKALSNTEKFDKKQDLVLRIEKVMEECFDQEEIVHYDPSGASTSQNVTRAAGDLSRHNGGSSILSLPLRCKSDVVGVVTLEFPPQHQLTEQATTGLAIAVELLAPQLHDRYQNDRWLIVKAGISAREFGKMVLGPKHTLAKLLILLAFVAILVLFNVPYNVAPGFAKPYLDARMTYRISAPFQFIPMEKRLVTTPYEGHIWKLGEIDGKPIEKGMRVQAGQVLVELDVRELRLELSEVEAEIARLLREADAYRNANPPRVAEAQLAEVRADQAEARRKLLEHRIEASRIRAPIDGEILEGDLRDKLGMKVNAGDVLFEIADRSALQIELSVQDGDIRDVREYLESQPIPGSTGWLATKTLPTDKYPFVIERIVPAGNPKDGTNVFKVYARVDESRRQPSSDWRPGMQGDARIEVDKRTIGWIWTHKVIDFIRLKLWV